jgi:hypothetical protein
LTATKGFVFDVLAASVAMTTDSHITFSRRPDFSNLASNIFGPWHNHLPVLGDDHWVVASTTKKLDGNTYTYKNGTAELDTGTSGSHNIYVYSQCLSAEVEAALCYLDDTFVKDFYAVFQEARQRKSEI